MAPYPNPRIVVAVTFEQGGFGVDSAAPAALTILLEYFKKQATAVGSAGGTGRVMHTARAMRSRPEPFTTRPGIAERIGLPYMDGAARLQRACPGRLQHLHPRPGDDP